MPKIMSYRKKIDKFTTYTVAEPDYKEGDDRITELCTIDGITYIVVPDTAELPVQPTQITLKEESSLPSDLREKIKAISPHVQLIKQRVRDKIAAKYSIFSEIKVLRKRDVDVDAFNAYNAYVEECVAWGEEQKSKLGLE